LGTFGECQVMGQPTATRWLISPRSRGLRDLCLQHSPRGRPRERARAAPAARALRPALGEGKAEPQPGTEGEQRGCAPGRQGHAARDLVCHDQHVPAQAERQRHHSRDEQAAGEAVEGLRVLPCLHEPVVGCE
jgi:hypothetical protein